ncbi:unnamed protein product, partial [Rotaria magnacalcarata]
LVKYADEVLLGLSRHLNFNVIYLKNNFSLDVLIKCMTHESGYRQCVVYLLGNTRIRLNEFYPIDKLVDLFVNAEILTKECVNVDSLLPVYTVCIDRNKIDASVRKSALEQMTIMFLEIVSNLTHALIFLLFD